MAKQNAKLPSTIPAKPPEGLEFFYARMRVDERLALGSSETTFYLYAENEVDALRKMDQTEAAVRLELNALFSDWEDSIMEHYREKNGETG